MTTTKWPTDVTVGIAIAADGALLVSDDLNGAIYRVVYLGGH